ncbi:hypothetical protein Bbelb_209890 [Branchiostoma belcheri]|nr:hypothetical protein Bbelb_209890 [Branchiostoma belcheri]
MRSFAPCVGQAHKVGPPAPLQLWRARPTISPVASDDVTRAGHLRTGRSPGFGELEAQRPKFLRLADACASAKRIKSGRRRHLQLWRARPTISPVASDDVTRAGHLRTGRSPGFGELEAQRPKFLRLADACASAKRIKSGRRRHPAAELWRARPTISPVASDDVTRAGHLRTGRSPGASAKRIKSGRRRHLQLWRARPTISPVASDDVTRAGHLRTGRSPGFGELEAQRPKFLRLADACASAKRIKSGRRRHLQLWRARPTISPVASDDVTRAGHLRTGRSPGASAKRIKSGRRRHLQLWRARPTISPVASDDVTRAGHLRTGRPPGFGELEAQRPKFLRLADACASAKRIKSGRRRHLQLWRARPTISPVASDDVTRAGHLRTGRSPGFGELEAQRPKFLRLADACASAKRIKSGRRRHLQLWRARPTISPVASDDVTRAGHLRTGRPPGFGELEAQRPKFLRLADACLGYTSRPGASAKRIKSGRRRHLQLWRARPTISPVASDDVTRAGHLRTGRPLVSASASAKRIKSGRRRHLQLWRARPTISPVASHDVTRAGHLRTGRSPGFGELEAQRPKFLRLADACASAKRIKSGRRRHLQLWRARPTISPVASDDVTRAGHLRTGRPPGFGELEAQRPKFLRLADACASAKRIKSGRRRHLQLWRARPTISPVASDDVTRAGHLRTGRPPGFGELEAQRPKFLRLADACASAKRIKSGRRRHLQLWRARPTISPVASHDVTRAGHLRTGRSPGFGELEAQRPKFLRLADACASAKRIKSGRRRHLQLWRARPTISPVASDDVTRAGHLRTGRSPGASAKRIKSGRRRHLQLWRARPTISPVASDDVTRAGHLRTGRPPGFGELEAQRPKFLRLADACASAKRIKSGRRRHLQLWRARPTISPVASDDVTRAGHLRTGRPPGFGELEAQRPKFLRLADACASAKRIKSGRRRHLQLWRARPTISPVASDDVTRAGHLRTGRSPGFGELEAQRPKFLRLADACASAKRIKSGRRRHLQLWRARPTISPVASDDVTRAGHLRTGRPPGFGELEAQRPKFLRLADACASAKRIKSGRRRHLQLWRARPTISPVASDDVTRAGHLRTGRSPGFGELEAQRPKFLRLADACASAKRIKSGRRRHLQLWRARPTISPVASDDVTRAGHLRTGRPPGFGELEAQRPKFLRLADACASAKRIKSGRRRHLQLWRARPTISPVASDDVTRAGHLRTGRPLVSASASAKRIKSGRRRHLQLWRARPTISPVASHDVTRAGHLRTGRSPGFGELEAQRPKFLRLADACASAKRIKSGRRRHLQLWRARPTILPVASDDVTRAGHLRTGRSPGFGELEAQRPKFLRLADACASAKRIKSGRRRHLQLWRARPTISPVASDDVTRAGHLRTGRPLVSASASAKRIKSGRRRHLQLWRARPTISPVASHDVTRAGHLRTGRSPGFGELEAQRPKFLRLADACASAKRIKSGRRRHLQLWRARPTISPVASDDVTRAGHLRTGRPPGFGELEAQRPKFLRLADACASAKRIKSGRRRHLQLWRARPTISPVASHDVTRAGHLRTGRSPGFGELEAQRPKFLRLADACASAKRIKSGRRRHLQLWRARPTISPVACHDVTRAGHLRTGRPPGFGELEAQRPKFLRLADACASAKRIKSGRRRHLQLWRARPTISPVASHDVDTRAGHLRTGRSPGASAKRIKSGRRRHLQLWRARYHHGCGKSSAGEPFSRHDMSPCAESLSVSRHSLAPGVTYMFLPCVL